MSIPKNFLYYGTDEPVSEEIHLCAGPLSMVFERGEVRDVRLGDAIVVRRVFAAVRDRNWGTVPSRVEIFESTANGDSFRITFQVENQDEFEGIDFQWRGAIIGEAGGSLAFSMDGTARSTFLRNRIGLCVLYPIECAGLPCSCELVDGARKDGFFPTHISPTQPFMNLRALTHEVRPGMKAEVRFLGDTFEMEDERNWSDAAFKIYGTPLCLPYPARIEAGTAIHQQVQLTLSPAKASAPAVCRAVEAAPLTITISPEKCFPLPQIGLALSSRYEALSELAIQRLRNLHLAHLRIDLRLGRNDYETQFHRAASESQRIGAPLEIAVFLSDSPENELKELRRVLDRLSVTVARWLVFQESDHTTSRRGVEAAREFLGDYHPSALIGGGTDANFAELNRSRPPLKSLDFLTYSLNPQVHASDHVSLIENLKAQTATVDSARALAGKLPLLISPVTLRPRFNAVATDASRGQGLQVQSDERQVSLFGAAWTVGSLKRLSKPGVLGLTYYENVGLGGVMEPESASDILRSFSSCTGGVYPMYHVFADVGEFAGGCTMLTESSNSRIAEAITITKEGKLAVLVANLTTSPQTVSIEAPGARGPIRMRSLDEETARIAIVAPDQFREMVPERRTSHLDGAEFELRPLAILSIECFAPSE